MGVWEMLNDDQWTAWDAAAKKENRRRHPRRVHRLNGHNLRREINSHQSFLGLPPILDPPERPAFGPETLGPLIASEGPDGVTLKLGVAEVLAGYVLVFGARPCSAGRCYCDKLRCLGVLPAPKGGVSDITRPYYDTSSRKQSVHSPLPACGHPLPIKWGEGRERGCH